MYLKTQISDQRFLFVQITLFMLPLQYGPRTNMAFERKI